MTLVDDFIDKLHRENRRSSDFLDDKIELTMTEYLKSLLLDDVNLLLLKDISFQDIAQHILKSFCNILDIKKASFMYYNENHSALMILASVGFDFDTSKIKQSTDKGISGWVYKNKKEVFAKRLTDLPPHLKKFLRSDLDEKILNSQSLLSIPIVINNEVKSLLNISEKKDGLLTDKDYNFIKELSSTLFDSIKLVDEVRSAQKLKDDMKTAEEVQDMILPKKIINYNSIEITPYLKSINFVGGDYYDFFESDNGTLNLIIADVSGHSIVSALLVNSMRSTVRTLLKGDMPLEEALFRLNQSVSEDCKNNGMFVTACFIQYHKNNRYIDYVNCGHQDILHIRKDKSLNKLPSTAMAIGMWFKETFEPVKVNIDFGDIIFLSTDGLHESINIHNKFYGLDRIDKLLIKDYHSTKDIIKTVLDDYKEHTKNQPQDDDMTMLAVKFINENRRYFKSSLDELENIYEWLKKILSKYIFNEDTLMGFITAVHEAVINSMEHANRFDESKFVDVEILIDSDVTLKVIIIDEANIEINMPEQKNDIISQERGRGLFLIHHFADEVNYLESGIEIILKDFNRK